jgi:predicted ATPase
MPALIGMRGLEMSSSVKSINVKKLFGRYDLQQDFFPHVNVLYSNNGGGKTTLLHILANALNGDFERFAFLKFKSITIELDDNQLIILNRFRESGGLGEPNTIITLDINNGSITATFSVSEIQTNYFSKSEDLSTISENANAVEPILPTAYFPAFRTAVDAWKSVQISRANDFQKSNQQSTFFARQWLLPFIPGLKFPSIIEIEHELGAENLDVKFKDLDDYLFKVNNFLEGKKISINRSTEAQKSPRVEILYGDGTRSKGLVTLSSGERQIIALLYAAERLDGEQVILIDEPEISLHVDWQRRILREMSGKNNMKQFIVCTHSPIIGADFLDRRMELKFSSLKDKDFTSIDDEELPF